MAPVFRRSAHYLASVCSFFLAGGALFAQVVFTSGTAPAAAVNTPYTLLLAASDSSCGNSQISFNSTDLPTWLSIGSGSNVVSGMPTMSGTYGFHVTATQDGACSDAGANVQQAFSVSVSSPQETFYVLNYSTSALAAIPINGAGGGFSCAWGSSGDPCRNYQGSSFLDFTADSAGNFYVPATYTSSASSTRILKFTPGSSQPSILVTGDSLPRSLFQSVAIDSAGNLIVADNGNQAVWLFPAGGGDPLLVGNYQTDVGFENVFVRIAASGQYVVAEDGGDGNTQIYRFTACSPSPVSCPEPQTPSAWVGNPIPGFLHGFTIDGGGNYVTIEVAVRGGAPSIIRTSSTNGDLVQTLNGNVPGFLYSPSGIFFDSQTGNFVLTDFENVTHSLTVPINQAVFYLSSGPAATTNPPPYGAGLAQIFAGGALYYPLSVLILPRVSATLPAPIPPLVLTGTALPAGFAYESYSATVTASGGAQPYTFTATGLPAGLAMNQYGAISGTTTQLGNFNISVTVTDSEPVSVTAMFTLSIGAPPPVVVPGGTLTATVVNTPVSLSLQATGGAPPYRWSLASGALPPGLTLQSSGTLLGTPLVAGTYGFAARATDTFGGTAVGSFTMSILPPPLTPTTSSPLPTGMVSINYGQVSLSLNGGTAPYTYALNSGSNLPAGLSMSLYGMITGVPASPGVYTFSVVETDSVDPTTTVPYSMTVVPYSTDLVLSAGSAAFSLAASASALPPSQTVQVQSSDVNQTLGYSVSISPASATWLRVIANGSTTPGSFVIALTSAASSLPASTTAYTANVIATCTSGSCNGSQHTVAVSLSVTNAPAQLSVLTPLLSFNTLASAPQSTTQPLPVTNSGGGSIGFASVACAASWCTVSGVPGSVGAGVTANFSVTANPAGLGTGYYYTDISIVSSAGATTVPVTFFIAANGIIGLDPSGAEFNLPQGGAAVGNTSFLVNISGSQAVGFTAAVSPSVPWLSVTQSSPTASGTQPATVNLIFNQTQVAALSVGTYYATVVITSSTASNPPQSFEVVLDVTAASQPTLPNPVPGGLIFLTQAAQTPPVQNVAVYTGSISAVSYQASAATNNGGSWLNVNPLVGSTSATSVGQSGVTADPSGLMPGVYTGTVSYQFSATAVRSVNVTMIVQNISSGSQNPVTGNARPADAVACAATQIVPTSTALVSNFAAPAAWPIELAVNLVDDCGSPILNGQVVATFSNGDPPLILGLADATGDYIGTWTPSHTTNQMIVNALASAPALPNITLQLAGAVTANNAPILAASSIANFFNPVGGAPLAPGTLVQITGQYLAAQTLSATTIPLPQTLGGTSIIIGGLPAPVSSVSPSQINAQVPFELPAGQPYQIIVDANNALTMPQSFQAGAASPGLSVLPSGYVQANHQSGAAVTESAPAAPGEYISVYLVGMGATTIPVGSGNPGPGAPYADTLITPSITLNNENTTFVFSGLIPGLVGVYQVNLQVPTDAINGDLPLTLSQDGFVSNAGLLPVHM